MDLFHGDATSAIIAYQGRVSNFLNVREARDLVMDCSQLGVPSYVLETLLCHTLVRYELIPQRIKIMHAARKNDRQALIYLAWIDDVMSKANYDAGQTTAILEIEDPTGFEDGVSDALGVVIGRFKEGPAREKRLRARMGVSLERLRAQQRVAERAAIGFFSYEMQQHFCDTKPHDELVAGLINVVLPTSVTYVDVQHFRAAYVKLQDLA